MYIFSNSFRSYNEIYGDFLVSGKVVSRGLEVCGSEGLENLFGFVL